MKTITLTYPERIKMLETDGFFGKNLLSYFMFISNDESDFYNKINKEYVVVKSDWKRKEYLKEKENIAALNDFPELQKKIKSFFE